MGQPDHRRTESGHRRRAGFPTSTRTLAWMPAVLGGALLALLMACTGAPAPRPPQPGAGQAPAPPPPEAPPVQPEPAGEEGSEQEGEETTVVIESGVDEKPLTLLEASRQAKERRKNAPPPIAVITNENLSEYAERGNLTISHKVPAKGGEGAASPGLGSPAEEPVRDETYWRETARELRLLWRQAADAIDELEERAQALRRQFYSEDDPYIRDTEVKPAWDRVLDRLEEARWEAEERQEELEAFLEEGRRHGALPGWLREGMELEPDVEPREEGDLPSAEPMEPVTVEPVSTGEEEEEPQ